MKREFALSLSRRHYFEDPANIIKWTPLDHDTYMSLYEYDDYVVDYFAKNRKLAGYDGDIYIPEEFILDIDGANIDDAQIKAIALKKLLENKGVPLKAYFSGTGFHFHIPSTAFAYEPFPELHARVKQELTKQDVFKYADPAVTDKLRLIRVPNTKNSKSGLYKVHLENGLLESSCEEIIDYAKKPHEPVDMTMECLPVFDVMPKTPRKKVSQVEISKGRSADPTMYPCISSMVNSIPVGKRHVVALRLAAWFRWRYPEELVITMMEHWRKQVSSPNNLFSEIEMQKIIESTYSGHGGDGNRYGCSDPVMDEHCKNTCRLFRTKKSQDVMDAEAMENNLIEFYKSDVTPLNIGNLYGKDFPIYPGEVVILQAPPKSMKTMLLQNWMTSFKVPTYFLEMEMSPRQIWSRFVMMENGWTEEELKQHYRSLQNGQDQQFKWLQVNFASIPARDLERTVMALPFKPRLVVVDHMGLFESSIKDPNMRVEEASKALMELAVKQNIVVIAVSEINKTAMREGLNIASSKGSFRTAYNANKILSLIPRKSRTTGLIELLHLRCEANREREDLNVKLTVNNVRIEYDPLENV